MAGIEKKKQFLLIKKAWIAKDAAEIKEWDVIEGIVKNVVAFGAFVDIGLKNDGLVHISQISDKDFVKDPNDFLEVGQEDEGKSGEYWWEEWEGAVVDEKLVRDYRFFVWKNNFFEYNLGNYFFIIKSYDSKYRTNERRSSFYTMRFKSKF